MNYRRIYNQIIENRKNNKVDCYTERHHIIPKSLGGIDDENNLVNLTAREHFLCHFLLAKMYEKESFEWYKMNHAFLIMKCESFNQQRYFNSRLYEALRKNFSSLMSLAQSGKNNSQYGTMWICNPETKENKKIKKDEKIPEGWVKGRNIWLVLEKTLLLNEKIKQRRESKRVDSDKKFIKFMEPYYFEYKNGLSTRVLSKKYSESNVIWFKRIKRYEEITFRSGEMVAAPDC